MMGITRHWPGLLEPNFTMAPDTLARAQKEMAVAPGARQTPTELFVGMPPRAALALAGEFVNKAPAQQRPLMPAWHEGS
jgi:hypothetical protein